ncbi:MAG: hypothetical protein ACLUHE_13195 [Christensenellales bacterium]
MFHTNLLRRSEMTACGRKERRACADEQKALERGHVPERGRREDRPGSGNFAEAEIFRLMLPAKFSIPDAALAAAYGAAGGDRAKSQRRSRPKVLKRKPPNQIGASLIAAS